jgi:diguanylate cyclase (GGDEF)-like protein
MSALEQNVKVLVADDSAVSRKLIEHALADDRCELIYAKSGREAIALFTEHRPEVVIVDWVMPDLTGIELCAHIRTKSNESYTYIIIVTGMAEKENVVAGLAAGADDYVTKPFHPEELRARVGVGLRIIKLHREIELKNQLLNELALTDDLTGLPNRRAIEGWASRQLSGAARYKFSFWIVVADLDHFKRVNDTYGHEAGDTVLKKVAEILKVNSRNSDICGRIGGEEFLLAVTHATRENVKMIIDRIRGQLEQTEFNFEGESLKVTASFGAAGFHGADPPDLGRLISFADAALYTAKRRGRNRTEFAEAQDESP